MQIIEFQKRFSDYPLFSLNDIKKVIPDFSYRQLDRWTKKGYLEQIKQEYYKLAEKKVDQNLLFYAANKIYSPSYVSLEKALKFHDLIPEEIFQITSVSTKKTVKFDTPISHFSYRHIKPALFFGYQLLDLGQHGTSAAAEEILMAEPEKAILDYLYLNPQLKTANDFREMRINREELLEKISPSKFQSYLEAFENKSLTRRAKEFCKNKE